MLETGLEKTGLHDILIILIVPSSNISCNWTKEFPDLETIDIVLSVLATQADLCLFCSQ